MLVLAFASNSAFSAEYYCRYIGFNYSSATAACTAKSKTLGGTAIGSGTNSDWFECLNSNGTRHDSGSCYKRRACASGKTVPDPVYGCGCPSGQTVVNGVCTTQQDNCPSGDLSGSTTDSSCDCPAGQTNVGGVCKTPDVCDTPGGDLSGSQFDGACNPACSGGQVYNTELQACQCPDGQHLSGEDGQLACTDADDCSTNLSSMGMDLSGSDTDGSCGCQAGQTMINQGVSPSCCSGAVATINTTQYCQDQNCPDGQYYGTFAGVTGCFGDQQCPSGQTWGQINNVFGCYGGTPKPSGGGIDPNDDGKCSGSTILTCSGSPVACSCQSPQPGDSGAPPPGVSPGSTITGGSSGSGGDSSGSGGSGSTGTPGGTQSGITTSTGVVTSCGACSSYTQAGCHVKTTGGNCTMSDFDNGLCEVCQTVTTATSGSMDLTPVTSLLTQIRDLTGTTNPNPAPLPSNHVALPSNQKETDSQVEAKKAQMVTLMASIRAESAQIIGSADSNSSNMGSLPCWRDIPLFDNQTFDICLSDYEDELSRIPSYILGLSVLLAALIIFRRD